MNERWVGVENGFSSKIISKLGHNLVFSCLTPNFERRKHFGSLEKIKRKKQKQTYFWRLRTLILSGNQTQTPN